MAVDLSLRGAKRRGNPLSHFASQAISAAKQFPEKVIWIAASLRSSQ
jgi:hypothetical protein